MKIVKKTKEPLEVIPPAEKEVVVLVLAEVHCFSTITTFNTTSTVVPSRPGTQAWAGFFTPQNLDLYHFETNQRNCLEVSNKVCSFAAE